MSWCPHGWSEQSVRIAGYPARTVIRSPPRTGQVDDRLDAMLCRRPHRHADLAAGDVVPGGPVRVTPRSAQAATSRSACSTIGS